MSMSPAPASSIHRTAKVPVRLGPIDLNRPPKVDIPCAGCAAEAAVTDRGYRGIAGETPSATGPTSGFHAGRGLYIITAHGRRKATLGTNIFIA
jgi:hypothetical protein